jgi:Peroxidase, family 2
LTDLAAGLDAVFGIPTSLLTGFIDTAFPLLNIPTMTNGDGDEVIDLDILYTHYGLEHDASMVREDLSFAGDRAPFSQELFDQCFVKERITVWALAACNRARILDTRRTNPDAADDINLGGLISAVETTLMMFFGDSPLMIEGTKDDFESFLKGRIPDGYHRRSVPELAAVILPLSVTLPSGLKALAIPVKKPDGSISSNEFPDDLISFFKTLATHYSSALPKPFIAFMETMFAELEQ